MKDRSVEMLPRDLRSMWIPPPRHQNTIRSTRGPWPRPGHHWKGYQSIQWRPWNPAVLWQRKNRSARRKNCRTRPNDANPEPRVPDCAPRGNSHYPNQLNLTTLRVASQRLASPSREEWFRVAHRGPPIAISTKHKQIHRKSSTAILNESQRFEYNDTNCQRPRNGHNLTKNECTVIKMNTSCTICAIMKRRCIKLTKITMDDIPENLLTLSTIETITGITMARR